MGKLEPQRDRKQLEEQQAAAKERKHGVFIHTIHNWGAVTLVFRINHVRHHEWQDLNSSRVRVRIRVTVLHTPVPAP